MTVVTELNPVQVRVLGCLVEKEATTPDTYPLSLNGLKTACNQKTSRDPVMALEENTIQEALDSLVKRTLAATRSSAGSRVIKYAHRLHDRLSPEFSFARDELAVMCLLFLRGPQTRGELRTRCARLHPFADTGQVDAVLTRLAQREDGPYVVDLGVLPGHKEARFAHLVCGAVEVPAAATRVAYSAAADSHHLSDDAARIRNLESQVSVLNDKLTALDETLTRFMRQFE